MTDAHSYEVYLRQGDEETYEFLANTKEEKFKVRLNYDGGEYNFKVRGKAECGYGDFSEVKQIVVDNTHAPHAIKHLKITNKDCKLFVKWTPPNDGGRPITEYMFEI